MTETRMKEESNEREGEMRQRNRSRPRLIPYTNAARLFEERVLEIYSQGPDGEIIRGNMIDYSMLGLDMEGEDNNDD